VGRNRKVTDKGQSLCYLNAYVAGKRVGGGNIGRIYAA